MHHWLYWENRRGVFRVASGRGGPKRNRRTAKSHRTTFGVRETPGPRVFLTSDREYRIQARTDAGTDDRAAKGLSGRPRLGGIRERVSEITEAARRAKESSRCQLASQCCIAVYRTGSGEMSPPFGC